MARILLHDHDVFVLWTTVMDAPLTRGLDEVGIVESLDGFGWKPDVAHSAIARAKANGTSAQPNADRIAPCVMDFLERNRAGADSSRVQPVALFSELFRDGAKP